MGDFTKPKDDGFPSWMKPHLKERLKAAEKEKHPGLDPLAKKEETDGLTDPRSDVGRTYKAGTSKLDPPPVGYRRVWLSKDHWKLERILCAGCGGLVERCKCQQLHLKEEV